MSGSWRGKNPIQRNAVIALAHFKEESAVPELIEMLINDPRPDMRGTIAWALGEIGTEKGYEGIARALDNGRRSMKCVLSWKKQWMTEKILKNPNN